MPTRNVVLTAHHESVIPALVKSERYQNASEVLREDLRLVEVCEARGAVRLKALREAARTDSRVFRKAAQENSRASTILPITCTMFRSGPWPPQRKKKTADK